MNLRQLREVASTSYYRRRPDRIARMLQATWKYSRHRTSSPAEYLERCGMDCRSALRDFERWRDVLQDAVAQVKTCPGQQGGVSLEDGIILYSLARALSPDYVIETGIAAGVST